MQPINFIKKPVCIKKYKALQLWLFTSLCLLLCSVIAITVLHAQQWFIKRSLQKEKQLLMQQAHSYQTISQKIQTQKLEHGALQTQVTSLYKPSTDLLDLLKHIKESLKNNTHLESLIFQKQTLEIKISGENTHNLVKIADILSEQKPTEDLYIVSLEQKEKNKVFATLRLSEMKKKTS